jgi:nucleotide-binding universal stress UspA family protein
MMIEQILVPLDGSSLAECVLPHVTAIARPFDAQVTLVRVVEREASPEGGEALDPLDWQMRKSEAEAYLDEVKRRLQELDLSVRSDLLVGKAAERIIEYAQSEDMDLIVLSSHGRSGLSPWNINSVVQKVILRAYVPALIVRAYEAAKCELADLEYERILLPMDGSKRAECVLPLATGIADYHPCRLLMAHVVNKPSVPRRTPLTEEERALVEELTDLNREAGRAYLDDLKGRVGEAAETYLLENESTSVALHRLIREEDVDLVILCAHGYSGEAQWPYGSIALNFIAYGSRPLLIVQDVPLEGVPATPAERAAYEEKGH